MSFQVDELLLPQNYGEMAGAKKMWEHIGVGKPKKYDFFRVLDDEKYILPTVGIIEIKEEGETYVIVGSLQAELTNYITPALLCVTMTRQKVLRIWPVKLPGERRNAWHDTALIAFETAKEEWICLQPNMYAGHYDIHKAVAEMPEPEWPVADLSFQQILEIAFRGFLVDTLDHPLIKRLTGQI